MALRLRTSDDIVAYTRTRARIPNKAVPGATDDNILDLLNDCMETILVPVVRKANEEYFCFTKRITIASSVSRYRIPDRAVGQQIRTICTVDGEQRRYLRRFERDELPSVSADSTGFYLEGNHVVFLNGQTLGATLEIGFLARPGQLVMTSAARQVQSIDAASKTINLISAIPASWEESTQGFDIHSSLSGAELRQLGLTKDNATGTQVVVNEAIDGSVYGTYTPEAGDWVCLSGEAVIPSIPSELIMALVHAAVMKWHQSQGDTELAAQWENSLGLIIENQKGVLNRRIDDHPPQVRPYNPLWDNSRIAGLGW